MLFYNFSYHFVKPLIGFIALLAPLKVKFESFIRILSIRLCF